MIEELKKISIRGRVALAATALQNALKKEGLLQNDDLKLLMDKIWEFTSSNALDEWEQLINEITPACILDTKETFEDFIHFDIFVILGLKSLYEKMPEYLVDVINCTISVGTDNIYGGTGDFSPLTLEPLLELIDLCEEHNIEIPSIDSFKKYNFDENNGWGREINKKDIID